MPGPRRVTFASAAPPVRYPHVYGINMPSRHELVAHGRTIPEIAEELGADYMVYQEVEDLKAAILEGSDVDDLDMSCFDGRYITGTVSEEYLAWVEGSQESLTGRRLAGGLGWIGELHPLPTALAGEGSRPRRHRPVRVLAALGGGLAVAGARLIAADFAGAAGDHRPDRHRSAGLLRRVRHPDPAARAPVRPRAARARRDGRRRRSG